jgi:HPt (histidine-containing phosphotransfer) domain-containing protein
MSDVGSTPAALVSEWTAQQQEAPEFAQLLDRFITKLQERATAIEQAFADRDFNTLGVLAHQLKGTAAGYGFPPIAQAAGKLEANAKARGALDDIAGSVRTVAALCRLARTAQAGRS